MILPMLSITNYKMLVLWTSQKLLINSHTKLIQKPEYYEIRGKLLQWIKSFLSNRSQWMIIEGCYSSPCKVTSGVPQSAVLGTTLFLIFIYHLISNIQSTIRLFANDYLTYWPIAIFFHWLPSATTRSRYSYLPAGPKHGGCNLMLINILSFSYPNTITKVYFHILCQASSSRLLNNSLI